PRLKRPAPPATISTRMAPKLTTAPAAAIAALAGFRARYAAHVENQPTPTASDPTSLIGTRIASPNADAAIVSTPINVTTTSGVPNAGCTAPSDGYTRLRRPIA